jgi:hypothetical protein
MVQEAHERALRTAAATHATAAESPAQTATPTVTAATERTAPVAQGKPEPLTAGSVNQKAAAAPVANTLSSIASQKKVAAVKSTPRPARKAAANSKPVFRAKGDRFDPLNPTL